MLYRTRFESEIAALRQAEVDQETPLAAVTHFLPIKLNTLLKKSKVAAHVPTAASTAPKLDVIVYLHGHMLPRCGTPSQDFETFGMDFYLRSKLFKRMRPELNASGHAAILIAPAMHPFVGAKGSGPDRHGNLDEKGKFDFLITQVFKQLETLGAITSGARIGNIVLAAHSGGGSAMRAILAAKNTLRPKIRACWGFESLYGDLTPLVDWLAADAATAFRHYRGKGKFAAQTAAFAKSRNFTDIVSTVPGAHCQLIREFWIDALTSPPFAPAAPKDSELRLPARRRCGCRAT
jgi:hypothetical protein